MYVVCVYVHVYVLATWRTSRKCDATENEKNWPERSELNRKSKNTAVDVCVRLNSLLMCNDNFSAREKRIKSI